MNKDKYLQGQEMLKNALAENIEEYHKLVHQKIETFSFIGFCLISGYFWSMAKHLAENDWRKP